MKKVFILFIVLLSSVLMFTGFSANNNAKPAEASDYNVGITANYHENGLLEFIIYMEDPSNPGNEISQRYTNSFAGYYENIIRAEIYIYKIFPKDSYIKFDKICLNKSDTPLSINETAGDYSVIISNAELFDGVSAAEIEIIFEFKEFELIASYSAPGLNSGNSLDNASFLNYYKLNDSGQPVKIIDGKIKYGDTLIVEPESKITFGNFAQSFSFKNLYFNVIDDGWIVQDYQIEINDAFLKKYTAYEGNKILFWAVYSENKEFKVSLSFNKEEYKVAPSLFIISGSALTEVGFNDFFPSETKLQITFQPKNYTQLSILGDKNYRIDDLSASDQVTVENGKVIITFNILWNKNFVIYLEPVVFSVKKDVTGAEVSFYKETFEYNEKIRMYSSVGGTNEIKSWKINGKDVPKKNNETADGITRINATTVEIDTAIWYELFHKDADFKFDYFKIEITTGMKTGILLAISIPVGVAVVFVAILLLLMLKHANTKKKIRILLEAEKRTGYTYNMGSMVQDLKEEKSLSVSNEEIKAKMKQKKK